MDKGTVIKSTGSWYTVVLENGKRVNCRIRGKLRLSKLRTTNPITVGDKVQLEATEDAEGNRIISKIEERKNYIVRKSINLSKQKHLLAANIDRAYLMLTLKNPETHLAFVDRFLVAAESFRIPTTLLINKIDLYDEEEVEYAEALAFLYGNIGYPTHLIQADKDKSVAFLQEEIAGNQVMVAGNSGVGKSTLIQQLDASLSVKIGEVSKSHSQGQHTTTFAEMFALETGGYIIDTPGIRGFGVVELKKEVMAHYFPEMRERMQACKFHNCQHINEPNCAVKDAVDAGDVLQSRYATYLDLMEENQDESYRKNNYE